MWKKYKLFLLIMMVVLGGIMLQPVQSPAQEADDQEEYEVIYEDQDEEDWAEFAPEGEEFEYEEVVVEDDVGEGEVPTESTEDIEQGAEEYFPEPEFEEEILEGEQLSDEELLPAVIEEEEEFEIETGELGELEEDSGGEDEEYEDDYEEVVEEYEDEYWEDEYADEDLAELEEIESAWEESQKIPTILTNLEDCKRVALLNDPRVQVALREHEYERYKVLESEREFLPAVKANWEKQEGSSGGEGGEGGDDDFSGLKYGLETTQIIFNGGKLIYELKQNKTNLVVAKKKHEQARQETIYKVEKAYYELVKTQMVFEIQADLSKAAESALSFSREAYRQGLNSYQEFLNVQSQTDQTYYQLLSSQQDIALSELELRQACNVDASIGIQINAVLTFTDFDFNYSLDECLGLSFKNRPDLAVNEYTTLADLYGIKISMAEDMPKLEFVGQVGKNGQSQKGEGLELSDEWSMKLQLSWILGANSAQYSWENKKSVPTEFGQQDNTKDSKTQSVTMGLFDKLENFSNLAKSRVEKATSEADLIELRGNVANEVEENYFNYQKAMTMVTASLSKIKFREKDLEINRAKQMMNEIPLSQVLTSELQLGEERVNYVQALADYYTSISGLFKAMGLSK
ncbi:TolC family protein [bacterium]|nr:TolC family protein [bacterium]